MAAENGRIPEVRVFRVQLEAPASGIANDATYRGKPDLPLQGPIEGILDQPLANFKKEVLDEIRASGMEAAIRNQKNPVLLVGGLVQSAEMHFVADTLLPGSSNELFFAMVAGGVGGKALGAAKGIAAGVEHAAGASAVEETAVAVVPLSRMEWGTYEKLVGGGGHPPVDRSMRDFSGKMKFIKEGMGENGPASVVHLMNGEGVISGSVNTEGRLGYLVIKGKGEGAAHGDEMFASMVKKFRDNGLDIHEVKDVWISQSGMDTNWRQFMNAVHAGATPEQAAMHTFTGKQAQKLGMTRAEVSGAGEAAANNDTMEVIYRKPDWGENKAWNDFANNWVSSMGRDLFRHVTQKSESRMMQEGGDLTRGIEAPVGKKATGEPLAPQSRLETNSDMAGELSPGAQAARAAMLNHIEVSGLGAREKAVFMAQVDQNLEQSAARGEKLSVKINVAEATAPSPEIG